MITGVEICMVHRDSMAALALYEAIFEVERVEVTDLGPGRSEVVFTIFGTRFHLLDESPEHMLIAPREGDPRPMWINVCVPDIQAAFDAAGALNCNVVIPITHVEAFGLRNAMFDDGLGYLWMLHQIDRVVSHEERMKIFTEMEQNN